MFIAIDKNKEKIPSCDAIVKQVYFCPTCGEQVTLRAINSKHQKPHFAHKAGTLCTDDWKYDMSEWHLTWQEKFPVECREVVMKMGDELHRADVLFHNVVIEFQHSAISREDFVKRNLFYIRQGYEILWIFDATNKIKTPIEEIIKPIFERGSSNEEEFYFRKFEWKRKQNQFDKFFYPKNARISVYLDINMGNEDKKDNLIIPLKNFDSYEPIAYHLEPSILVKNFLKEYKLIDGDNILSIGEIIEKTKKIQATAQEMRRMRLPIPKIQR